MRCASIYGQLCFIKQKMCRIAVIVGNGSTKCVVLAEIQFVSIYGQLVAYPAPLSRECVDPWLLLEMTVLNALI